MRHLLPVSVALVVLFGVLSWPTTTKQGVNYMVTEVRLPLYVKLIDFISRDAHYRRLAREITAGARTPTARALALFAWTTEHVRQQPDTLPVMDDHVWHTIVRGYGMPDQVVDVLTTLCSYADVRAIRYPARTADGRGRLNVAAVWLDGHWRLMDPYHGVLLRNRQGGLASMEDLRDDPAWLAEQTRDLTYKGQPYAGFFETVEPLSEDLGPTRTAWQHPWRRLLIEAKRLLNVHP